jgi:hypothetical protein
VNGNYYGTINKCAHHSAGVMMRKGTCLK